METVATPRTKRRGCRWFLWATAALVALLLLGFGLSNIVLATSWGRAQVGRKIQSLTGLETQIGSLSWSPWNGITLGTIRLLQPPALRGFVKEPILSISRLNVMPVWKSWLHGQPSIQSITAESPRGVLAIEAVSSSIRIPSEQEAASTQEMPATPPLAALQTESPPPPILDANGTTKRGPDILILPNAVPKISKNASPPVAPDIPTKWIHVKDASFQLISVKMKRTLAEVSNTTGKIPFSGNPAKAILEISNASLMGQAQSSPLKLAFSWQTPVLSLVPMEIPLGRQKVMFAAKIAKLPGIPFQWEVALPNQPLAKLPLPMRAEVEAEAIGFQGRFSGALTAPKTWQGDFIAEFKGLKGTLGGRQFSFDQGRAITLLRGHILSCVDARMEGEELSLLGNGTLLADGRASGVMRFVATPEGIQAITNHLFSGIQQHPVMTPLGTPQRVAFDLHTFGNIGEMYLQLGQDGPILPMNPNPPQR